MPEPRDRDNSSTIGPADLRALAERRDPLGILSVYVDADPGAHDSDRRPWETELDVRMRDLAAEVKRDGPRERWQAFEQTRERVAALLDTAASPATSGRARVVFASLSDAWTAHDTFQLATTTEAILDQSPRIRPLVKLFRDGAPAGAVIVSRDAIEMVEVRLGYPERLGGPGFEGAAPDSREKKGPAAGNPARAQQTAPQRDRHEHHVDDRRERFLASAAATVADMAASRGWDELLLMGDPRLAGVVEDNLAAGSSGPRVSLLDINPGGLTDDELAAWMRGELAGLRSARRRERVQAVIGAAVQGRAGVTSADEVLVALAEGRVEALLYDEDVVLHGTRLPDGRLVALERAPAEIGAGEEPLLIERMIEMALATEAEVVPLSGTESDGLEQGVGAALRW